MDIESKKVLTIGLTSENKGSHRNLQVKWQKQSGRTGVFYHLLPKHKFDNNSWMNIPMWKSGSSVEKFQQTIGGKKNLRLDTSKRVRGRVLLYPHHTSPKVEQLSAKQTNKQKALLNSQFHSQRRVSVWMSSWLP